MVEVKANELTKRFGRTVALQDLSLTLRAGEITVLLGPSGCGKTTFLRILAGLDQPDRGTVTIGDRIVSGQRTRVPAERRGLGMVFQDALLWPHLTVAKNIAFPLGSGKARDPRVEKAATRAEVLPFLDRMPSELSGGERQRVAVARAIVHEPSLLLLDEPLTGLDANLRVRLLETIRSIRDSLGLTACYVTHDQEEALGLADRIVLMRSGRILQEGTPEEVYAHPRTAFVAGFLGLSNLLPVTISGSRMETSIGSFPASEAAGTTLLCARPETVRMVEAGGAAGVVRSAVYRGDRWLLTIRIEDRDLLAISAEKRNPGETLRVMIDPPPVPVLDDRRDEEKA